MEQYKNTIEQILKEGDVRGDRTGVGTTGIFGHYEEYNLKKGLPAVSVKKLFIKSMIKELRWLITGSTNMRYLKATNCNIWNEWAARAEDLEVPLESREAILAAAIKNDPDGQLTLDNIPKYIHTPAIGDLGPIYGAQLRKWPTQGTRLKISSRKDHRGFPLSEITPTLENELTHAPGFYEGDLERLEVLEGGALHSFWHQLVGAHLDGRLILDSRWHMFETFSYEFPCIPGYEIYFNNPSKADVRGNETNCTLANTITKPTDGVFVVDVNCEFVPSNMDLTRITIPSLLQINPVTGELAASIEQHNHNSYGSVLPDPTSLLEDEYLHYETHIDQLADTVKALRDNPLSRRHVIDLWNPEYIPDDRYSPQKNVVMGKSALPPCHYSLQFYVKELEDGTMELSSLLLMRSNDGWNGRPFNISSYALLTMMVAKHLGYDVGKLCFATGDLHLYSDQIEPSNEMLKREPRPLPQVELPEDFDLFNWNVDDVVVTGYDPHPAIKVKVAV